MASAVVMRILRIATMWEVMQLLRQHIQGLCLCTRRGAWPWKGLEERHDHAMASTCTTWVPMSARWPHSNGRKTSQKISYKRGNVLSWNEVQDARKGSAPAASSKTSHLHCRNRREHRPRFIPSLAIVVRVLAAGRHSPPRVSRSLPQVPRHVIGTGRAGILSALDAVLQPEPLVALPLVLLREQDNSTRNHQGQQHGPACGRGKALIGGRHGVDMQRFAASPKPQQAGQFRPAPGCFPAK